MRSPILLLALLVFSLAACGGPPVASLDQSLGEARAAHILYTETNDPRPGMNAILAYRRGTDGSLTPLPGSPFTTGGVGVGDPTQGLGPLDSDQEVIASPDRRFLFAVNGGSNTIAVFRIRSDGTLRLVEGAPFPSGGSNPVSLGLSGHRLYVVNKDQDPAQDPGKSPPNYTGFVVDEDGRLHPIPGSTVRAPAGSSPSQALVAGHLLFDAQFMAGALASFRITHHGTLEPAPGTPQKLPSSVPPPALPLGLAVHPHLPLLYADFVTANEVGIYLYDDDSGALDFATTAPVSGKAPCWARTSHDGGALYTVNTGDNSVSFLKLDDPVRPAEVQHLVMAGPGSPFQEEMSPDGRFLYVVSQRTTTDPNDPTGNGLHILKAAQDGSLTEAAGSPITLPVPPSARPQGLVVL